MRIATAMRRCVRPCAALVATVWVVLPAAAAELRPSTEKPAAPALTLLPADRGIDSVVDHYVDARLATAKVKPAEQITDANLVRRLTLDLVGRVPTPREIAAYSASKSPKKREELVDRLLASPEFVDHQVNEFNWLLMQGQGALAEYLQTAFREKRSWDRVFRDVMLGETDGEPTKGATEFLKGRVKDQDRMTNDVSSLFFGVNISCAQCHDHPLAKDWKQDHFYGLKSFLARTYENGGFLGERDYGLVTYQTPKGEQKQAKLMFLSGKLVDEPKSAEPDGKAKKAEQEMLKKLADKKQPPPKPKFSRRSALIQTALGAQERSFFARSIVNRLWLRLYGHGLVMPVDQMHSANPASHPELLDWLARDTAEHGFELPRLVRGLVLSKAYSRSSRWTAAERPDPSLFAAAQVRPLGPYQYAASLRVATTDPEVWTQLKTSDESQKRAASIAGSGSSWAGSFAPLSDDFQVGVNESLQLANDPRVLSDFLSDAGDRIVGRLKQLGDPAKQADCAISTVLGRPAEAEERKVIVEYLTERKDRSVEAARQVVWSLLTGSEFRFNY